MKNFIAQSVKIYNGGGIKMTKVKLFKYQASIAKWKDNGGGECLDTIKIEKEISAFCRGKQIRDIKINSIDYDYLRESKYDCRRTVSLPSLKGKLEIA